MKKYLFSILVLLLCPLMVFAKDKALVKVYVYEAGGCPYCEAEIDYLKGLDSYNKKFKIVRKELYVDHVEWKKGKDYDTGVKVANGFLNAGFTNASYSGTPFVVISDIYASTGYSTSLEEYINEAYENGDKDIVKCVEDGKDNCFKDVKAPETSENYGNNDTADSTVGNNNKITSNNDIIWVVIVCTIVNIAVYIIKSNKDKYEILNRIK